MHLLRAQAGEVSDGSEPVELAQSPGEIVVLSASDTELAALAGAQAALGPGAPSLRLAQLAWFGHPYSVDLWVERTAARSKLVIARLMGGEGYWPYLTEQLRVRLAAAGVPFVALPGDDRADPGLMALSTLPEAEVQALWSYLVETGPENLQGFLRLAGHLTGRAERPEAARPLLRAGLYWRGRAAPSLADLRADWVEGQPVAALVFYRALLQGGSLGPVDALIAALRREGLNPLPVFAASLKDPVSAATLAALFGEAAPDVVLNGTAFAVSSPGGEHGGTVLDAPGAPVLQVIFAGSTEEAWRAGTRGLGPRDIAMNVALPEIDGRILARAVSFKAETRFDAATECPVAGYRALPDRVDFTARLAARWAGLRRKAAGERRVAIVLANYPDKDGRLANGVGLDTPASVAGTLADLAAAGYRTEGAPADGAALMAAITAGPTNWLPGRARREGGERMAMADYRAGYARLPEAVRAVVEARWGAPEADPFAGADGFALSILRFGNAVVGVQPARGYGIDPKETYHAPDLVPPHNYIAFYLWLREQFGGDAVIHMGKHGNMEWLPGKAVALSEECFPEAVFGPMPHLYPFIVNDPGEGTQAKRRAQAVIVDHLTPPLARAETYGPLRDLELLVDEYYQAAGQDPRRIGHLRREILALTEASGIGTDAGIAAEDDGDARLQKLDAFLCDIKESQIRDGLHIFGQAPVGGLEAALLVALTRVPRGAGEGGDASLIRALAADLGLGFDPLDCRMAEPWAGPRPGALEVSGDLWRTAGDTVERLELLALRLVEGAEAPGLAAAAVMAEIEGRVRPALRACGAREREGLRAGLDGRFLAPGPSGAPTRGRLDVLPTGRNFYSVDTRAVPTRAAWALGWRSAYEMIERHMQMEGDWPRAMAVTAWGTSNMRTGGDDIAQALALMGVRPRWDDAGGRVTGFEIMPAGVLGRPRVDVTLRISGFFRDAFPGLVDLFDSAARAVMALDEQEAENPAAARFRAERQELGELRAGFRVFGSKPGAYGAGLQAMIDERLWRSREDLAAAYLDWGSYAYGHGAEGAAERGLMAARLSRIEAVVQNQDNREHDLLDSDDYYQFEGGIAAAVEVLRGKAPVIWHNDHSRPERPVIRTLEEEVARVVRARVVNPKWIAGVKRHGYKGAFEIAATVDYLFAFAATTGAVRGHHFDLVHEAFLADPETRGFIAEANPAALREIAARLGEAIERGLWQPRSNTARALLGELGADPAIIREEETT